MFRLLKLSVESVQPLGGFLYGDIFSRQGCVTQNIRELGA